MLFEEDTTKDHDWFDVCPNADFYLPSDDGMKIFDLGRMFLSERDRVRVADALHNGLCNRQFFMHLLIKSDETCHQGFFFAARELYLKIPDKLLCSVLAFSHAGGSRKRLVFPEKQYKIPKSLMGAFGLRSNHRTSLVGIRSKHLFHLPMNK